MTQKSVEISPGMWLDEFDDEHFAIVENGRASVFIARRKPRAKSPTPVDAPPFDVRASGNVGQEILDGDGKVIAWTTDEAKAALICKLLTLHKGMIDRRASSSA
jgi:hypothetical protein